MKKINPFLPALTAGFAGYALRRLLYRSGLDNRGLLNPADPLHLLCWLLILGLGIFLLLRLRKDSEFALPRSLRLFSAAAAALLLAFCARTFLLNAQSRLQWFRAVFCCLTAAASALAALMQGARRDVHPALHTPACLFFAADMLCRYQNWSGNPQLADYCFALGASVCLCLAAYQTLALPARLGNRRSYLMCALLGLSLCLFSMAGPEADVLYLAGAFWILSGLQMPVPEPEEEDYADS